MVKLIITLIFCGIGIILGFSSPSINNQLFSGIVNMIGILAFFWQYIYSHLDAVYLKWNIYIARNSVIQVLV